MAQANNLIQIKRTSLSGRAANTTTLPNPGELALNMADGIMYSGNGSVVFEIGANNTNVNVSGNLAVKAIIANNSIGAYGQVLYSSGSDVYWGPAASGFTGSRGDTGYTGSNGTTGFTGSKGDIGYTGSIGFTGSVGAGYTGSKGDTSTANATSQYFVSNGSNTTYTLLQTINNSNNVLIVVDGLVQIPNIDYTIVSTTLTLSQAAPQYSSIEIRNLENGTGVAGGSSGDSNRGYLLSMVFNI